jgi:hypothetical protein
MVVSDTGIALHDDDGVCVAMGTRWNNKVRQMMVTN